MSKCIIFRVSEAEHKAVKQMAVSNDMTVTSLIKSFVLARSKKNSEADTLSMGLARKLIINKHRKYSK